MNVLNWPGGPFLQFYIVFAGGCLLLLYMWRHWLGPLWPKADSSELSTLEMAYLAGGHPRCMDTLLVGFFEAGALLRVDRRQAMVSPAGHAGLAPELRDHLLDISLPGRVDRVGFRQRGIGTSRAIRDRLAGFGLIVSVSDLAFYRLCGALLLSLPLILGATKIIIGLQRERPVGYLCGLMIITALQGAGLLWQGPFRTRAGGKVLDALRRKHARAARAPCSDEMMLAFALSGAAVLIGQSYMSFFAAPNSGTGGSGCGGASGCGGGGGGCGGCGSS